MKSQGFQDFRGETRISNLPMQKVFEQQGFDRKHVMESYYDHPTEDAYRYEVIYE